MPTRFSHSASLIYFSIATVTATTKLLPLLSYYVTMDAMKRRNTDQRKEYSRAPLPGTPNVRYRVPAKPLWFELWGAHEDLLLIETRPQPRRDSKLER